jgi:hypothetical protein
MRGDREKFRSRFLLADPRGVNPKGGAGDHRFKTPSGLKALPGGMNRETEVGQAEPAL